MAEGNIGPMWYVRGPQSWPILPRSMSVSTLQDIEACPRRWSLRVASYPHIWRGHGYPPQLRPAVFRGMVVHRTLQVLTAALARAGCSGVGDATLPGVLRAIGGYTKAIDDCVDHLADPQRDNPRMLSMSTVLETTRAQIPTLRQQVQLLMSRVQLPLAAIRDTDRQINSTGRGAYSAYARQPLHAGSYAELELHASGLGWIGKIDLLKLSTAECEIVDFKTGAPSPDHQFQILVYNLLWTRDADLNPTGRVADRLTLAYVDGDVAVRPTTGAELCALEEDLQRRTQDARTATQGLPPQAKPSWRNCHMCPVRQLCDEYWSAGAQQHISVETPSSGSFARGRHLDVEVEIARQRDRTTWDATVLLASGNMPRPGSPVQLHLPRPNETHRAILGCASRARLLDVVLAGGRGSDLPETLTLTSLSEAYAVHFPDR